MLSFALLEGVERNHFVSTVIQSSREQLKELRKLRLKLRWWQMNKKNNILQAAHYHAHICSLPLRMYMYMAN